MTAAHREARNRRVAAGIVVGYLMTTAEPAGTTAGPTAGEVYGPPLLALLILVVILAGVVFVARRRREARQ